ncbi:MAG: hypothetical protein GF350_05820 [Chitinivibrionales bacterium]|nr:hypothetical protein [Chitinivibrionales bacterium]
MKLNICIILLFCLALCCRFSTTPQSDTTAPHATLCLTGANAIPPCDQVHFELNVNEWFTQKTVNYNEHRIEIGNVPLGSATIYIVTLETPGTELLECTIHDYEIQPGENHVQIPDLTPVPSVRRIEDPDNGMIMIYPDRWLCSDTLPMPIELQENPPQALPLINARAEDHRLSESFQPKLFLKNMLSSSETIIEEPRLLPGINGAQAFYCSFESEVDLQPATGAMILALNEAKGKRIIITMLCPRPDAESYFTNDFDFIMRRLEFF